MSAEEEGAMREEDRFRQCEKLKVACDGCGETATVDSVVRGISDTDRVLALARCADPKCDRVPVVAGHVAIKNALTMAFREIMFVSRSQEEFFVMRNFPDNVHVTMKNTCMFLHAIYSVVHVVEEKLLLKLKYRVAL